MAKDPAPKKEVMSLRIEPKIRYLIDIAAKVQRRNISNYVEWALEESLKNVDIADTSHGKNIYELSDYLWDVSEAKRFITLATLRNDLLSFEEQKLWNVISGHPLLYLHSCPGAWMEDNINFDRLEKDWQTLLAASHDDQDALDAIAQEHSSLMDKLNKKTDALVDKVKAFLESTSTQQSPEEYQKQANELEAFLDSLTNNQN